MVAKAMHMKKTEHVHAHVLGGRSRRKKNKSPVLLDSGVRRNDASSTKSKPNDLNALNDPNKISCK